MATRSNESVDTIPRTTEKPTKNPDTVTIRFNGDNWSVSADEIMNTPDAKEVLEAADRLFGQPKKVSS